MRSVSSSTSSVKPQSKQTSRLGNTKTHGLLRYSKPRGGWMLISEGNPSVSLNHKSYRPSIHLVSALLRILGRDRSRVLGGESMALIYFSLDSRSVIDITPYSEVTDAKKPGPGPTCIPSVLKVVRMRSPDTPRVAALDADSTRTCQK